MFHFESRNRINQLVFISCGGHEKTDWQENETESSTSFLSKGDKQSPSILRTCRTVFEILVEQVANVLATCDANVSGTSLGVIPHQAQEQRDIALANRKIEARNREDSLHQLSGYVNGVAFNKTKSPNFVQLRSHMSNQNRILATTEKDDAKKQRQE